MASRLSRVSTLGLFLLYLIVLSFSGDFVVWYNGFFLYKYSFLSLIDILVIDVLFLIVQLSSYGVCVFDFMCLIITGAGRRFSPPGNAFCIPGLIGRFLGLRLVLLLIIG